MAQDEEESKTVQYPLDSKCYKILDEIGRGASAIVYKAICLPMNSSVVAIKAINLDQSRADFDSLRREAKIMSLLSHPNILQAHCFFTVDHCLWVVMPFMSAGSLQSIITSAFPDGLPEPCISIVLKETLFALSYLHDQGHLHRDVKAGNILVDSNGSVKLADFGVSASIYESNSCSGSSTTSSTSTLMLTDVAGTPYWMAPEVILSHTGYSFKADIWSFGITALELAHGRPPLSHLPPSKSLLMKLTKQFRFSDYEKTNSSKKKKFSKSFKDMVGLCLDQDPSKRPSAEKLLKHSFFKNCKGLDLLVKNVLQGLPTVEQRFMMTKLQIVLSMGRNDEEDEEYSLSENIIKQRRISGWNFNVEDFELNPVFPMEKEDEVVKQVRFGGETIIEDKAGDSGTSSGSNSGQIVPEIQVCGPSCEDSGDLGQQNVSPYDCESVAGSVGGGTVDGQVMLSNLLFLKNSLEDQKNKVINMIALIQGKKSPEINKEEQLMQMIERLKIELEAEKKKNSALDMELEFLKFHYANE